MQEPTGAFHAGDARDGRDAAGADRPEGAECSLPRSHAGMTERFRRLYSPEEAKAVIERTTSVRIILPD